MRRLLLKRKPISQIRQKYTVVSYFALFFLLFYFILVFSCENCWNWPQYNPYLFAFVFAFVATYFVFLIVGKFNQLLHQEEEKLVKLEGTLKAIGADGRPLEDKILISEELKKCQELIAMRRMEEKKSKKKKRTNKKVKNKSKKKRKIKKKK